MPQIVLINPFITTKENARLFPPEPLGLLYLASYFNMRKNETGISADITILDACLEGSLQCFPSGYGYRSGLSDEELFKRLMPFQADIIGISSNFTSYVQDTIKIAEIARSACPGARIVVGGSHATIDHLKLVANTNIDIVVRSEGEVTFFELVQSILYKKSLRDIAGITYKNDGIPRTNADREFISDLDSLPIPDRTLIDYEKYISRARFANVIGYRNAKIFSSRGCPYKCVFCSTRAVWRNKWRCRSSESILREIQYLQNNYTADEITFEDDQFLGSRDRIIELCDKLSILKNKIHFAVPPGISPALLDAHLLKKMKNAGFYRVTLSIDAGNQEMLRFTKKPVNLSKMRDLVKTANKLGLWTCATFVLGFPDEDEESINKTISFAYGLHLDFITFYTAQPHLGSALYDIYKERGLLDNVFFTDGHVTYDSYIGTNVLSAKRLNQIRNKAESGYILRHLLHFLNPAYFFLEFLPKFNSSTGLLYFLRLLRALLMKRINFVFLNRFQ